MYLPLLELTSGNNNNGGSEATIKNVCVGDLSKEHNKLLQKAGECQDTKLGGATEKTANEILFVDRFPWNKLRIPGTSSVREAERERGMMHLHVCSYQVEENNQEELLP